MHTPRCTALAAVVLVLSAGCTGDGETATASVVGTAEGSTTVATEGSATGADSTVDGTVAATQSSTTSSAPGAGTTTTVLPAGPTSTFGPVPVDGLHLAADGLGDALFGDGADEVLAAMQAMLGPPSSDTGWVDPVDLGRVCPGTEVRLVAWGDLSLFFADDSLAASGVRHFAAYNYGEAFGPTIMPAGLTTFAGVGMGASLQQLEAAYPAGAYGPGDELSGPVFLIEDGLFAHLEDQGGAQVVTAYVGGFGCGE